jgi:hypothetical protein
MVRISLRGGRVEIEVRGVEPLAAGGVSHRQAEMRQVHDVHSRSTRDLGAIDYVQLPGGP